MERYLVSQWALYQVLEFGIPTGLVSSQFLGIPMGPKFWLGGHTPTHFLAKYQYCGASMFSLMSAWISCSTNSPIAIDFDAMTPMWRQCNATIMVYQTYTNCTLNSEKNRNSLVFFMHILEKIIRVISDQHCYYHQLCVWTGFQMEASHTDTIWVHVYWSNYGLNIAPRYGQ